MIQPMHRQILIDEIITRIKSSCDNSSRVKNVVRIGELIKISPLLKMYRDEKQFSD